VIGLVERGHSHQAEDLQVGERDQIGDDLFDLRRAKTVLLFVSRNVDFQQAGGRLAGFATLLCDRLSQAKRVDRVQPMDQRDRPPRFVSLQVADQVPADRWIGHRFGFLPQDLRAIFSQVAASGAQQSLGQRHINVFRDSHDRYFVGAAANRSASVGNLIANRSPVRVDFGLNAIAYLVCHVAWNPASGGVVRADDAVDQAFELLA